MPARRRPALALCLLPALSQSSDQPHSAACLAARSAGLARTLATRRSQSSSKWWLRGCGHCIPRRLLPWRSSKAPTSSTPRRRRTLTLTLTVAQATPRGPVQYAQNHLQEASDEEGLPGNAYRAEHTTDSFFATKHSLAEDVVPGDTCSL